PLEQFALASLVRVDGSSYRRPGARMLICQDGLTIGSLSGGCIEEQVALRGLEVVQTGVPITLSFDNRKLFGCHGKIEIFIERIRESFLRDLAAALDVRRSCLLITTSDGSFVASSSSSPSSSPGRLIQRIEPPLRLLIFGHGPDSAPLHRFADLLGWETIELDDAHDLTVNCNDRTAAVVKSHNYGRDFAALQKLLPLNLRYVGLLGPRKRRDQLLNDLLDSGITINAGFFGPAGLNLGSEGPDEIALSIVSEIQRVFGGGSGESYRDVRNPIHTNVAPLTIDQWTTSAP
ncbi:MAG TPA: XdhC family protein, partial [Chthoniobacterales bacterium]